MKYDTDEIKSFTAYRLANEAEVTCPDSPESAGAVFLTSVRDATVELLEYKPDVEPSDLDYDGAVHEIADGAPSCYTYTRWMQFTDLAAWQEDIEEYGPPEDMNQGAAIALLEIARRLVNTLAEQAWVEDEEDDSE